MKRACRNAKALASGKAPADMVTEALMAELKFQLNVVHQKIREEVERERREQLGVDYTWLASNDSPVRRQYEIPEMKRIELEQMCGHVCPTECGRVLLAFRQLVADQQTLKPEEIPQLLRTTIGQMLSQRPITGSTKHDVKLLRQRLTRSLSNIRLRPSSRVSVAPLNIDAAVTSNAPIATRTFTTSTATASTASNNTVASSLTGSYLLKSPFNRSQSANFLTADFN